MKTLLAGLSFAGISALLLTPCLDGQQSQQQQQQQQTQPGTPPSTSSQTTVQVAPPTPGLDTTPELAGPWSLEVYYWATRTRPSLRGGKAATDYENLGYFGHGNASQGIDLSFPVSRTTMLSLSGFVTKGTSNGTLGRDTDLFGTPYFSGELISSSYTIKNFKASFQDLLYPFPRRNAQRFRVKTLWEVQYVGIYTAINAPLAPTTDSAGNAVVNYVAGNQHIILPTFGLGAEYHLSKNVVAKASASGFGLPHHSLIAGGEASIGYRLGSVELIGAGKLFYFKTSTQAAEYFAAMPWGGYGAVRWYPSKFSVPCFFCRGGRGTQTAKTGGPDNPQQPGQTSQPGQTADSGQTNAAHPNVGTSSSANKSDRGNYVRRVTAGVTVSFLGLPLIPKATNTVTDPNNANTGTLYDTTGASQRIGYGITGQLAITDHFAVAFDGLIRRIGYQFNTTTSTTKNQLLNGVVQPVTTTTSSHEDTHARLIDIPVLLRYYSKDRHSPGPRWFVEGGGALRDVTNIRTSLSSTDSTGTVTCCSNTPAHPANSLSKGVVSGAGLMLIDPVGIHVTPEVRYTRWMNPAFNSFSTNTQRNEVAAGVSLTF